MDVETPLLYIDVGEAVHNIFVGGFGRGCVNTSTVPWVYDAEVAVNVAVPGETVDIMFIVDTPFTIFFLVVPDKVPVPLMLNVTPPAGPASSVPTAVMAGAGLTYFLTLICQKYVATPVPASQ